MPISRSSIRNKSSINQPFRNLQSIPKESGLSWSTASRSLKTANFSRASTPASPSARRSTEATKRHKSLLCDLFRVRATHGRRMNVKESDHADRSSTNTRYPASLDGSHRDKFRSQSGLDAAVTNFKRVLVNADRQALKNNREKIDLRDQDLSNSIGLVDYFNDDFVVKLLNYIHGALATGGKVILGNFHPRNPDKALMDHVFD